MLIEDWHELTDSLVTSLTERGYISDVLNFEKAKYDILTINLGIYSLVIIDCISLSPNHLELCRYIHTQKKELPIIIATSSFNKEDAASAFVVGASKYIPRPFSINELEIETGTLAHESVNKSDKVFVTKGLKLDSINKKVWIEDRLLQITKKEFAILELLMHNFGEIVSRKKILESIWSKKREVMSNTIDVHIKNLRKKLKFRNVPKIETSRASGYRITEK
ncbi:MAG: response regulator transcription factor [Candidatus Paceibacterota bacterium]